jgi:tRNA-splicing endonuclease subunit Sen2
MSLADVWSAFQAAHSALPAPTPGPDRFDNPLLVNYVAYHHYRALGWVVKGGIKFCVDLLLYKRGPVFSHAECVLPPPAWRR